MHSQKVFFIFFAIYAATVLSKPFTIDVLEAGDLLFPKQSDLVKRTTVNEGSSNDVAELSIPKISLSSYIDNIESGLVHTALSVAGVAGDSDAQVKIVTPQSVSKRSTVDGSANATVAEGSHETLLVQTTENILASKDLPAHVVIDRVSVYKAPVAGAVLFPTFHLHETILSSDTGEVLATVVKDEYVIKTGNGTNSTSSESSESSEESSESSESTESAEHNSTSTSTTTIGSSPSPTVSDVTSTSSTTPLSVEEKQIIENNLKEKVAEVEAEPVILTARV